MVRRRVAWNKNDLIRRLLGALDVAQRAIERLGAEGYSHPEDSEASVDAGKIVAETAMLLLSAWRVSSEFRAVRQRIDSVSTPLAALARSDRTRLGLSLYPALAQDYAFAHICLNDMGLKDELFDDFLCASLEAAEAHARERLPHRVLEQLWLHRLFVGGNGTDRVEFAMARASMLGRTMDSLSARRDDVYAFTHALLYFTDLGQKSPHLPRPKL